MLSRISKGNKMRMNGPRFVCIILAAALVGTLLSFYVFEKKHLVPDDPTIDFNNYQPLAQRIGASSEVILYEGLPHQYFERELLATERKTKPIVTLHEFPFYRERLPLTPDDGKRLTALFCDGKSLKPNDAFVMMGGRTRNRDGSVMKVGKACGGFHPDYCIEWKTDGERYQVLVCLGCSEMKCYGPRIELYCDFEECGKSEFANVLKKYRKNRPKFMSASQAEQASEPGTAKVKVLVALEELPPHYQFQDENKFKTVEVSKSILRESLEDTITSFDQIKGRQSRHYKLRANEPIYKGDLDKPIMK